MSSVDDENNMANAIHITIPVIPEANFKPSKIVLELATRTGSLDLNKSFKS